MNDKEKSKDEMILQGNVETQPVEGELETSVDSNGTRPEPSWGVITEGDPKTSLWETIKVAIRG